MNSQSSKVSRHYESADYVLPADEAERERLDLQHRLIFESCDRKLILAPVSLKEGDRVLEVGAGTGIWALDLLNHHSGNIQIDGIDISNRLFPSSLPENMHFSVNSVLALPDTWSSLFAFVHQRLLIAALTVENWKKALSEIYRVLAPGGWVELVEPSGVLDLSSLPGPQSQKLKSIAEDLFRSRNMCLDVKEDLSAILQDSGFLRVTFEEYLLPTTRSTGAIGLDGSKLFGSLIDGMKEPILKSGGVSEKELYDIAEGAKEEVLTGEPGLGMPAYVFYAQKPGI